MGTEMVVNLKKEICVFTINAVLHFYTLTCSKKVMSVTCSFCQKALNGQFSDYILRAVSIVFNYYLLPQNDKLLLTHCVLFTQETATAKTNFEQKISLSLYFILKSVQNYIYLIFLTFC